MQDHLAAPAPRQGAFHPGATAQQAPPVLIVEDDAALAAALARTLRGEGYAVNSVNSGEAALETLEQTHFEVLVLDITLPGIDGFEVLRRLRASGHSLAVLVLTALDDVSDRVRGLNLGADDYMTKPFALSEFLARVRALGRRRRTRMGRKFVHGPLVLDTSTYGASWRGTPIPLARRECAILQVLIERAEKIVPKTAIIDAVTGRGEELSENAVEVYVSRLRAKLKCAGIRIRTVRGYGYMLLDYYGSGQHLATGQPTHCAAPPHA